MIAAVAGLAAGAAGLIAAPASAYASSVRVDLRVLVANDGSSGVDTIVAQLDREAVPYDTINLTATHTTITAATLSDTVGGVARAKYQGVVLPNEAPAQLTAAEMTALADFEKKFGVRQIDAYTWAGPNVGLSAAYSGSMDGAALTVTAAAKAAGFGYLAGTVRADDRDPDVAETYGYLGTAVAPMPVGATFTPMITGTAGGATGSLIGLYTHDNREELVVTVATNRYQTVGKVLGHGLVSWLTQGVHLGYWRNFFSVNIDDVLMPDSPWDPDGNCTVGDDCTGGSDLADIRMTPADVDTLIAWQKANKLKLDLAFNGEGAVQAGSADPLTAKLVANRGQFRWINHTYGHMFLGCVQDFTDYPASPWRCATDAAGNVMYVSKAEITSQINQNITWAQGKGIAVDRRELVTGEHSGLITAPQMTRDNPYLASALSATGVQALASDASRETEPRAVGPARTVPRHPTNVYYNTSTRAAAADEYNWIYTSRADGGSGICEDNAASTCITPLDEATGYTGYIVPTEATIAFDHIVSNDADPHFAHQSNLTGDRILYPLLNEIIKRYRATFTTATPMVNPRLRDTMIQQRRQQAWQAAVKSGKVTAYVQDKVVTVINNGAKVDVPITVPVGTRTGTVAGSGSVFGSRYGTDQSTWKTLATGARQQLRLP